MYIPNPLLDLNYKIFFLYFRLLILVLQILLKELLNDNHENLLDHLMRVKYRNILHVKSFLFPIIYLLNYLGSFYLHLSNNNNRLLRHLLLLKYYWKLNRKIEEKHPLHAERELKLHMVLFLQGCHMTWIYILMDIEQQLLYLS